MTDGRNTNNSATVSIRWAKNWKK